MRVKLLLLMVLACALPSLAQNASVSGTLVDEYTGAPLAGATVMLREQGIRTVTGPSGQFTISKAQPGQDYLLAMAFGYNDVEESVTLVNGKNVDLGFVKLMNSDNLSDFYTEQQDMLFDEQALDDEESTAQTINALTGASDNIYYNASNYNFSTMYFRFRGYDSQYQTTYINGINMNDPIRGRFNYSSLGGMTSRAFRNRTTTIGLGAANYGFGNIGGSSNISTITSDYATGFNGSVAYTNANYMLRAMATYVTGINKHGWGLTVSAVGRYANEGVIEGTFYNSAGLFISAEKVFNENHSLTLTAYGAPTQRATASATYQEAYDLADNNLYNPNWGYWNGKKRASRIVESFDPTAMLNWIYDNHKGTSVNTGAMFRSVYYSSSALNWFNTSDPRPDYYRNLPSNFLTDSGEPTEQSEYIAELWRNDESVRQINWDRIVHANQLNNLANQSLPESEKTGASYILENRVNHSLQVQIASNINHRLNSRMTLQGGVNAGYTSANYYKSIRDLLGGEFWIDVDPFSNRDMTIVPDNMQNDLDNPNRRVYKGDKFGYDYTFHVAKAGAWAQNQINLPQWDINYGVQFGYTGFHRTGHMRNGRAPQNSLGAGKSHDFFEGVVKAGATWKIDGRNYLMAHAEYGSHAPLIENVYISPRIKDNIINDPKCERILSADFTYGWNYRKFRGAVTFYATEFYDATERNSFYDDDEQAFTNHVLSGVRRENIGIEVGIAYKILPSLTAEFAGTVASYRYKNNPMGMRSYENGLHDDVYKRVYLKNYRVGGTPQQAYSIGLDWAAPKQWFLGLTANWMRDSWVKLAPIYHEYRPTLWAAFPSYEEAYAKQEEISRQARMNNAFSLNFSIGKLIYINRKVSLNVNLNVDNITNNKNIMQNAWQQGRLDTQDWNLNKYPNKYSYAQGTKVFLNVGVRF